MQLLGKVFRLREQEVVGHYWIIISEPCNGKVLCVNITDGYNHPDSPCHVQAGEHQNITKPSSVIYRKARAFDAEILLKQIQNPKELCFFNDASPALLSRIIEGAKKADDLTAKFLNYLS